ncbi:MAG: four-carbon acid sugar kinase family protein, partial [Succinivibrio sp.]
YDCLVYATNSRKLTPQQSYQMVFSAAKLLKSDEVKLYAKRIDPAMRGNTCTETEALLDALGDTDRVAIVVPAFPTLKRTNVGGYILVDGKPLQKSLAGLEDLQPAESGRVADLFTEKFRYKAEALHLKEFLKGTDNLALRIKQLADSGTRAIVLDCTSQEDINMIADAVVRSKIKFLAVDPGPFTATLARKVTRTKKVAHNATNAKIFGIVGGVNPLISAQVELLRLEEKVNIVTVHNLELLEDQQRRNAEINRVVDEIITRYNNFSIAFAVSDNMEINNQLSDEYQEMLLKTNRSQNEALDIISTAYGQITCKVLEKCPDIQALYTKGAEFTVATLREVKSMGLKILGQVLPLTCYGEVIDGNYAGLKCVTSASSATDTNTITDSIQYIKRKLAI